MESSMVSPIRLLIALSLLTTSAVALAPGGAACTFGPGPAGTVCVTDYNHSYGDTTCQGPGYSYGSTYGYVTTADSATVSAAGDQHCMNSGGQQRHTQQVRFFAAVWGVAGLEVRFTDSDDSTGDWCQVDASVNGDQQAVPCPQGVVPVLPWGSLLPW